MRAKIKIRKDILNRLRTQKEEARLKKSKLIEKKLFGLAQFKKAKTILFYVSFDGEVETLDMINDSLKKGKRVAIPVCDKKAKKIVPCLYQEKNKFTRGPYGILEPKRKIPIPIEDIDMVIVPGIAYDRKGNRLGRGAGYYDRFLKVLPKDILCIGLAFSFQLKKYLPCLELHDLAVDKVISA